MDEQVRLGGVAQPELKANEYQMEYDDLESVMHQLLNLYEAAKTAEEQGPTNPLFGDFVRAHEVLRKDIHWAHLSRDFTDVGVLINVFAKVVRSRLPVYGQEADAYQKLY